MEHAEHRHTPAGTPPAQRERPAPGADENPAGGPAPGAGAEPAENAAPGPLPAPGSAVPTGRQNSAPALRAVCVLAGAAAVLSALALGCAAALCLRLWPLGSQAENTPGGALAAGAPAQQPAENDGPASLSSPPESGPPAQQSAADPLAAECPAGAYQQVWMPAFLPPWMSLVRESPTMRTSSFSTGPMVAKTASKPSARSAATCLPLTIEPGAMPNSSPSETFVAGAVCTTTNLLSSSSAASTWSTAGRS